MKTRADIRQYSHAEEASEAAARFIMEKIKTILKGKDRISIALPGGSAPRILNASLISVSDTRDYSRIDWFFGDERAVEPESPWSNYRMQKESLFDPLKIPEKQVFRMKGELGAPSAAVDYSQILKNYFQGSPVFNLILLGLGPDGHTASLFPGSSALSVRDVPVTGTEEAPLQPHLERITLTLPVINAAENVIFFTGRTGKESVIDRLTDDSPASTAEKEGFPFEMINPESGSETWFIYRGNK